MAADVKRNSCTPLTPKDFVDTTRDVRCGRIMLFVAAMAQPPAGSGAKRASLLPQRAVLDQYCVVCHNQKLKTAGLMLDKLDLAQVGDHAEQWEKVVRKLRAGMMPPSGMPRPNAATYEALTVALENELDRAAAANPHLPAPGVHRVNRTEYANAIHSLLALDIDPAAFLPADDSSYGFDNVVSGLDVSPALVEGYVDAAAKISRLALGHETAPARKIYHVREDYSQEEHIEGLPFGTRGGMLIHHYFPADGEYSISWDPVRTTVGGLYGGDSEDEQAEVLIDGAAGEGVPHRQGRADRQPAGQERGPRAGESGRAYGGRYVFRHHLRAERGSESPLSPQHSRRQSD